MNTMLITNGKLVTPDRVIDNGELLIEQGIIKHIGIKVNKFNFRQLNL